MKNNQIAKKGVGKMVFWSLFSKKQDVSKAQLTGISDKIGAAFTKIRSDFSELDSSVRSNEKQIEQLNKWIEYIYSNQQALGSSQQVTEFYSKELSKKHAELDRNHKKVHSSHQQAVQKLSKVEERLNESHKALSASHQVTKKEVDHIKEWLHRFSAVIERQKASEAHLQSDMEQLSSEVKEVLTAYQGSLAQLNEQNSDLLKRVESLEESLSKVSSRPVFDGSSAFSAKSESSIVSSDALDQPYFEKHLIARAKPNRRSYILNMIMETISSNNYSTKEIEDIIVKEKQLCGRTTFYSYIKELRDKNKIDNASINDRLILVAVQNSQNNA
jgi:hypothetical protein